MPPYTFQVEAISGINIPGLHSFAFAKSGDKWLFVGGRTNGLHGLNSSGGFPPEYKNDNIIVVDTSTWNYYTSDINQLPYSTADPLRSNNMQYVQSGKYLYIAGGYGYDSTALHFRTFPTLTAINIDSMIYAVMSGLPIASYIRQVSDTNLTVCGGEMAKLGNDYYLMFGHNFTGRYADPPIPIFTQVYSNAIKKFNIIDNDTTITLANFTYQIDTTNFHRRDLNTAPIVKPGGTFGIGAYGGVFRKDVNLPFTEPIRIDASSTTVNTSYHQVMSQYTCALMPVFDSVNQNMYTTFFGGISSSRWNDTTSMVVYDSLVPFIKDITTLTVQASGTTDERIMTTRLPDMLGTNAKFIPNDNVPHYSNDVIKIKSMPNNTQTLVGYMFGGIRAAAGNFGATIANDSIYRIYITPNYSSIGIAEYSNGIDNTLLYPNPTSQYSTLYFSNKTAENIRISLNDVTGREVMMVMDEKTNAGNHQVTIPCGQLSAGVYVCKMQTEKGTRMIRLIVK
jgi:hypothetical protein